MIRTTISAAAHSTASHEIIILLLYTICTYYYSSYSAIASQKYVYMYIHMYIYSQYVQSVVCSLYAYTYFYKQLVCKQLGKYFYQLCKQFSQLGQVYTFGYDNYVIYFSISKLAMLSCELPFSFRYSRALLLSHEWIVYVCVFIKLSSYESSPVLLIIFGFVSFGFLLFITTIALLQVLLYFYTMALTPFFQLSLFSASLLSIAKSALVLRHSILPYQFCSKISVK